MPRTVDPASVASQARAHGCTPAVVYSRLQKGWSLDEALTPPQRPGRFAAAVAAYLIRQAEADLAWSAALLVGAALTTIEPEEKAYAARNPGV